MPMPRPHFHPSPQRWVALLALALLIGAIFSTPEAPYPLKAPAKNPIPAPSALAPETPKFRDRTLALGLNFVHSQGEEQLSGLDESLGPGACAFDYDNDGWVDLFLVNGSGQTRYYGKPHWWQRGQGNALFRNLGGRAFQETTEAAGLKALIWGMGCVAADFDNDGDQDLWVTARGGSFLYRNEGAGRFADVGAASGIVAGDWSTTAAVADYDGDGLVDVYLANYVDFTKGAHTYEAGTQFFEETPGRFSGQLYQPNPNRLYRNLGLLRFEDATAAANVANREGRSLGALWFDADADPKPDILVGNDRGVAANAAFLNRGGRGFEPAGLRYGLNSSAGHRGIALGDIDGDGALDLALASGREHPPLALLRQPGTAAQTYIDRARELGIAPETASNLAGWTPGLQDFDNDGRLDLFMANGLLLPDPDTHRVPQGQPKRLWLNRGGGFAEVSAQAGTALQDTQSARGAAFADFDNDGDIDIYVAHNNDLGQLLLNTAPQGRHWFGVHLVGGARNRDAIGAKLILKAGTGAQVRVVAAGGGFASDNDRRAHFGLGGTGRVDSLRVEWPDGAVQEFRDLAADRYVLIRQGADRAETATAAAFPNAADADAFAADSAVNRRRYLRLLVKAAGVEAALPELRKAQAAPEAKTRLAVVKLLSRHKSPVAPALLVDALEDADPGVATQAVRALCEYEDEASVRWLLRAFRHPAPEVRQALGECFAYFFQEEEAVVHRKYLALPKLIDQLGDPAPEARIAAMRALGNAERYRAMAPLLDVLADSQGAAQAEAARALGLIRERKAAPGLLRVLSQPEATPEARAQALIALKRLDHPGFDALLGGFLEGRQDYAALPPQARLATALAILVDGDDGVVIGPAPLLGHVLDWAGSQPGPLEPATARVLVATLKQGGLPQTRPLLETLATHPDPSVRAAARVAPLAGNADRRPAQAEAALRDAATEVRLAMLEALRQPGFPRALPGGLLLELARQPETRTAAARVLYLARDQREAIAAQLTGWLDDPAQPDPLKLAALEALAALGPSGPAVPEAPHRSPNPELRRAALAAWCAQHPGYFNAPELPAPFALALADEDADTRQAAGSALAARPEAWAQRAVQQRLSDPQAPFDLRKALLRGFGAADNAATRRLLLAIANNRLDPLRYRAMRKLARLDSGDLDAQAWQWLKNPIEPLKVRILAAKMLIPRQGAKVLDELRGNIPPQSRPPPQIQKATH